ncbi:putative transmembrane protein [Favolaschia claudopus]|uniref:Transmembrane protein n=1 Tax=Favolaschia claudopus TaxID=2862362 RepID=A0AAW0DTR2_9AGAR
MAIDKFSMFRIISFSLAGGDVVQTIPDTYRLYRKQWVNGNLSAVCFFYAFQVFGIVYHRNPFLNNGSYVVLRAAYEYIDRKQHRCKGRVPVGDTDWNVVYYSAHMAFDLFACITATTYIILVSRVQGTFNTSRFLMRVLRNGILYTAVVFLANLWVVLEFTGVFVSGAASTLPLAVMMIGKQTSSIRGWKFKTDPLPPAAQHLILSTQRLRVEEVTSLDDIRDSRYNTPNRDERDTGPARFYSSERDEETQPDVYVLSKQRSTQRSSTFDPEDKSGTFDPDSNGSHTLRSQL